MNRASQTPAMHSPSYYHYFAFGLERYISRLLLRVREEAYSIFMREFKPSPEQSILDIGLSADDHASSNYFEKRYPHTERISGLSVQHFPEIRSQFEGMALIEGDGRSLPFQDGSFDFVHSHAVIEHVGNRAQQARFLEEALRVARRGVFVTTPNRWHPVETHTGLPLVHFLPAAIHRRIFKLLGKTMYATEGTLNLIDGGTLLELFHQAAGEDVTVQLQRVRWLGFTSNLVLVAHKKDTGRAFERPALRNSH
jgi:hypothetical protein